MERLPEGLLSTATKVSTEMDGMGAVDIGDVVQLWRGAHVRAFPRNKSHRTAVYSTNPSAHHDDLGYRLENLFWRIWSSHCLHHTLQGSTLATLFLHISEPSSLCLEDLNKAEKEARASKKHNEEKPMGKSTTGNVKAPLHPILKKPRNGVPNGEPHKTTRLLLTGIDGQSTTRKPSYPLTPVPPAVPTMGDTAPRQTQKKAFVVASKAKHIKRRPVLLRRKSSQQSSSTNSTRAQSPQPNPPSLTLDLTEKYPTTEECSVSQTVDELATFLEDTKDEPSDTVAPTEKENPGHAEIPQDTGKPQDEQGPSEEKAHQVEENPVLPEDFVSDLVELLDIDRPPEVHVPPPRPRYRGFYFIKPTLPKPNFFSYNALRRLDPRFLYTENYVQPSSMKLVDKNFRQRFSERVRQEQIMFSTLGAPEPESEPAARPPEPIRAESSSTIITNDTPSPSQFGDSHGNVSTAPSSAMPLQTLSLGSGSDFSTDSQGTPEEEAPALATPISGPPGPSQLSVMIERSRHEGTEENAQIRYRPEENQQEIDEILF
ncbi:hypothetical protein BO70DRAFT_358329 [Aspergillus heteromorphus CBS 117.55]|uniref:Uncharacterized protein n=1 Tax=Aspergillus heteromorphus CBS 117.55 TaxID=1448321 RepID=A0A317WWT7_9EURO|nr:uncharacterized protein BO70DRAFT_358329 [Aspergillus heteromorphus CBS 117.55]PWY90866.1 hypothetical protein BO70DRAFT_358329 [Aspergillus heteromorphus CBS 117.55]